MNGLTVIWIKRCWTFHISWCNISTMSCSRNVTAQLKKYCFTSHDNPNFFRIHSSSLMIFHRKAWAIPQWCVNWKDKRTYCTIAQAKDDWFQLSSDTTFHLDYPIANEDFLWLTGLGTVKITGSEIPGNQNWVRFQIEFDSFISRSIVFSILPRKLKYLHAHSCF